jgi:DNA polymerase III subunit beta
MKTQFAVKDMILNMVKTKGNIMPIMSSAKLTAKGEALTIETTDLEVFHKATIQTETKEDGSVCVSQKDLLAYLKTLPKGAKVQIESQESNWVMLSCGSATSRMIGVDPAEFPLRPEIKATKANTCTLPADMFNRALATCTYCMSVDQDRLSLNGIFLRVIEGHFFMACTDGYRLAKFDQKLTEPLKCELLNTGIIIPRESVKMMIPVVRNASKITLSRDSKDKNLLNVSTDTHSLIIRLLDAVYPDVSRVIPKDKPNTEAEFMPDELLPPVSRMAANVDKKNPVMELLVNDNKFTMKSFNANTYSTAEEEATIKHSGEIHIGLNAYYLVELLKILKGEKIKMEYWNPIEPLRFTCSDSMHLIMPMRI